MAFPTRSAPAVLGNTRTIAVVEPDGSIGWLALPDLAGSCLFDAYGPVVAHAGAFILTPHEPLASSRTYIGETSVLQTTFETATGRATLIDFLPVRVGQGGEARFAHDRLVRVLECTSGEVGFDVRFAPRVDGQAPAVVLDPNGILFVGNTHTLLLQTEAHIHSGVHEVSGSFRLGAGEKRHFVLTWLAGTDPDVPEMRATEPDWDLDATMDYWIAWSRRCAFKGVQRDHVLRLAAHVRAAWVPFRGEMAAAPPVGSLAEPRFSYDAFRAVAPIALAVWGWEDDLDRALTSPPLVAPEEPIAAAFVLAWLAAAQHASLMSGSVFVKHWARWHPAIDRLVAGAGAWAGQGLQAWRVEAVALADGLNGAAELAEDLLLPGDAAQWRAVAAALLADAPGPRRLDDAEFDALLADGNLATAVMAIEAELADGGYLQARRRMDRWLLAYDPLGPGRDQFADARALFLAARLYLVEPPTPGRVHLPGDLGE